MSNKEWAIHVLAQPEAHTAEMVATACRLLAALAAKEAAIFSRRRPLRFYIA